jgi:4-diphosphocytidyl-2-C-methyl-D-erythritol kinase
MDVVATRDEYLQQLTVERAEGRLVLRSPAKINLFLEPLAKRPDGYHEIVTVMQTIDLCDEVAIELTAGGIEVESDHPQVPSGPENLAWRAVEAFASAAAMELGARVRLTKRIPPGGGLGGGSSNAAVVLLGLNELTGWPLTHRRRRPSVPMCHSSSTAVRRSAQGAGSRCNPSIQRRRSGSYS